ncbi:hypothetical protein [Photorhabdus hindustanensis]|uniref:Uncharacterized protein n=1 Tax=Photorhabdus hindustanensis TaxID=2918802 RepID=A0A2S8PX24_9GAMM|nr:hypothetical protein [Photorhabdus hindustanensis]PQQ23554.1 hypothetical protein C6H66_19075 [Photorhabdus hindustanensis]
MSAQTSLVRKNRHSIFHNEKNKPHYFEWSLSAVCKAVHFFYLSDQEYDIKGFIDKFEENSKFLCNVFSAIVGLHIKRIFLKELEENYEIEPEFYNSRIYLSAEKRGNIIDSFYPRFNFFIQKELVLNLHRKVFRIEKKSRLIQCGFIQHRRNSIII